MDKRHLVIFSVLTLVAFSISAQEPDPPAQRKAAFAGTFYPAEKTELQTKLKALFHAAANSQGLMSSNQNGKVQTIIVPHAGLDYSGTVVASAYRELPENSEYRNIFIITNTHRRPFEGISTDLSSSYQSPLGEMQVNLQICRKLIDQHPGISYHGLAHEREQGIEVQLPFIQHHFKQTPSIVPIIMGSSSLADARKLAAALLPWFTPENLFIISADFSRYPSYEDAKRIDQITADAVMTGNPEKFYNSLAKVSNSSVKQLSTPSGDWSSIMTLLYMAHQGGNLVFNPVLYQNSGDSPQGDKDRVVGYWALAGRLTPPPEGPMTLSTEDRATLLEISRSTLETFIRTNGIPELPSSKLSPTLKKSRNVLVSLYMGDRLRGRLEYLSPPVPMASMTQEMTLAAAILDERFSPVVASELEYITIELSVLSPLRKINDIQEIDPEKHGVYLNKDERTGLFLPGKAVQENWSIEDLLGHCAKDKAGLAWEDWKEADLYIFEAISFRE